MRRTAKSTSTALKHKHIATKWRKWAETGGFGGLWLFLACFGILGACLCMSALRSRLRTIRDGKPAPHKHFTAQRSVPAMAANMRSATGTQKAKKAKKAVFAVDTPRYLGHPRRALNGPPGCSTGRSSRENDFASSRRQL